jgi:uncharacterized coiled-coil protein SlyX
MSAEAAPGATGAAESGGAAAAEAEGLLGAIPPMELPSGMVALSDLPRAESLQAHSQEFDSMIAGDSTPHDPHAKNTISSLSEVAHRVQEYTKHEEQQVASQQRLIHDLMRCVAENHKYIALQQEQLNTNTAELIEMRKLLGGGARRARSSSQRRCHTSLLHFNVWLLPVCGLTFLLWLYPRGMYVNACLLQKDGADGAGSFFALLSTAESAFHWHVLLLLLLLLPAAADAVAACSLRFLLATATATAARASDTPPCCVPAPSAGEFSLAALPGRLTSMEDELAALRALSKHHHTRNLPCQ